MSEFFHLHMIIATDQYVLACNVMSLLNSNNESSKIQHFNNYGM